MRTLDLLHTSCELCSTSREWIHDAFASDFLGTVVDSFEARCPCGNHLFLAYVPLREPIWLLQLRSVDGRYNSDLFKWTFWNEMGYLHFECHIIQLESSVLLDEVAKGEAEALRTLRHRRFSQTERSTSPETRITILEISVGRFRQYCRSEMFHALPHPIQPNSFRTWGITIKVHLAAPIYGPWDLW